MKVFRSLQGRLLALVMALVLATWAAVGVVTWSNARHELDELLDAHLAQAAALLVAQQAGEVEDHHSLDAPMPHRYAPRVAFQVYHEGRLVLRSSNAPPEPMLAGNVSARGGFFDVPLDGSTWRVFATSAPREKTTVLVGEQRDARTSILRAMLEGMLQPMVFALPLLAVAVWWAVASGIAPLRRLASMLRRRRPENLSELAMPDAPAELGPVLDALNGLFDRVARLLQGERRFTADAAHELRTPIAAIRAHAQVALSETDDRQKADALRATLRGCDRASRVVEQLLTLSRVEGEAGVGLEPSNLRRVAREVLADAVEAAQERGQSVSLDAPDGEYPVLGNETLLKVLLRNLVDNALRYSRDGANVEVRLRREADSVVAAVLDDGPGMSDADVRRLGERFFRSTTATASGSGLGWSIVRRIAEVHRADVMVRNRVPHGLEASVRFPSAAPPAPA